MHSNRVKLSSNITFLGIRGNINNTLIEVCQIGAKETVTKSVQKLKFVAGNWIKLDNRYAPQTSTILML
jgi:hypothetical protein